MSTHKPRCVPLSQSERATPPPPPPRRRLPHISPLLPRRFQLRRDRGLAPMVARTHSRPPSERPLPLQPPPRSMARKTQKESQTALFPICGDPISPICQTNSVAIRALHVERQASERDRTVRLRYDEPTPLRFPYPSPTPPRKPTLHPIYTPPQATPPPKPLLDTTPALPNPSPIHSPSPCHQHPSPYPRPLDPSVTLSILTSAPTTSRSPHPTHRLGGVPSSGRGEFCLTRKRRSPPRSAGSEGTPPPAGGGHAATRCFRWRRHSLQALAQGGGQGGGHL